MNAKSTKQSRPNMEQLAARMLNTFLLEVPSPTYRQIEDLLDGMRDLAKEFQIQFTSGAQK